MRDPKQDPQRGDVLRWLAGDAVEPVVFVVVDRAADTVYGFEVQPLTGRGRNIEIKLPVWQDWRHTMGFEFLYGETAQPTDDRVRAIVREELEKRLGGAHG